MNSQLALSTSGVYYEMLNKNFPNSSSFGLFLYDFRNYSKSDVTLIFSTVTLSNFFPPVLSRIGCYLQSNEETSC